MTPATCPPIHDLERLYRGGLAEYDAQVIEDHILECPACGQRLGQLLNRRDTLTDALASPTTSEDPAAVPVLDALIRTVSALRATAAPNLGVTMILFSCPACQKKLSVKPELAGKQVKCSACGKVVAAPAAVAVGPAAGPASQPEQSVPRSCPTTPPENRPEATQPPTDGKDDTDTSLTDFLSPPQGPDELGRLGNYRILKILGHGGMGVVFRAEDTRLKRSVALKAMLPGMAASASAGKRFIREAQAMAAVEHDHIVRIYQVDEERGVPFLAMEFLKGEPLDVRLDREKVLPVADVLRIGAEIAEGLAAAHATDLIHRDIKPANVWLEAPKGRVKILDFGLARATSSDAQLTQQGAIVGTPAYMAPEQATGDKVDGRSDLFSLGVVLYRLCTGTAPFIGKDTVSTLMAVAMQNPPPPREVNAGVPLPLSQLIMKMLDKNPDLRPKSAKEVAEALRQMAAPSVAVAAPVAPAAPPREPTINKTFAFDDEPAVVKPKAAAAPKPRPVAAPKAKPGLAKKDRTAPPNRKPLLLAAAAIGVLAVLGAAAVFFLQTDQGTIRIEITDPAIQVALDQGGFTIKGADKHEIKVTPGEHGLRIKRGDLDFETSKFVLKKGETVTLKIESLPGKVQVAAADGTILGAKMETGDGRSTAPSNDYALQFDGLQSTVAIRSLTRADARGPMTIEAYVTPDRRLTGIQNGQNIVHVGGPNRMQLYQRASNWAQTTAGANGVPDSSSPSFGRVGTRMHVAAVYDGKLAKVYVNGSYRPSSGGQGAIRGVSPGTIMGGANPPADGDLPGFFAGLIDEVRISTIARYDADFTPAARFEPDKDTLALYHCDEGQGDVLHDVSGNGHDGKIVGAKWVKVEETPVSPTPVPAAKLASGLQFNGQDTHVLFPTLVNADQRTTIEGWFELASDQNMSLLTLPHANGMGLTRLTVAGRGPQAVHVRSRKLAIAGSHSGILTVGKPFHLAAVFQDSNRWTMWLDGKKVADNSDNYGWSPAVNGVFPAILGKDQGFPVSAGQGRQPFHGTMRELRVSKTARYTADFAPPARFDPDKDTLALYHFDEGQGDVLHDASGNGHDGKIVGARWVKATEVSKPGETNSGGFGLSFAEEATVEVPSLVYKVNENYTFEAFVTEALDQSKAAEARMVAGFLNCALFEQVNRNSISWPDGWYFGKGSRSYTAGPAPLAASRRIHLAGVRDGTTHRLFIDGQLVATQEFTPAGGTDAFFIGKKFKGIISEVRVSKVARYDKSFNPIARHQPDADTLALWHFDEGEGDVLHDASGNGHDGKIVGAKWVRIGNVPPPPLLGKNALDFADGSHQVLIESLKPDCSKPFTFEAHVVPRTGGIILHYKDSATLAAGIPSQKEPRWMFSLRDENAKPLAAFSFGPAELGKSVHIAGVFADGELRLFLDGKGVGVARGPATPQPSSKNPFAINGHVFPFTGTVSQVRISRSARYSNDFTPQGRFAPDADTLALYHFDEGQGDVLHDASGNGHDGKIVGAKWVKTDSSPLPP